MRYMAEAWYCALSRGRRCLIRRLIATQDALGDVHDADVRTAMWGDEPDRALADWLRERCDAERSQAWDCFQDEWPKLMKCLSKKRLRRLLPA